MIWRIFLSPIEFSEKKLPLRAYCPNEYAVPEGFVMPSSFRLKYIPRFPNYSKSTSEIEFRLHLLNFGKFFKTMNPNFVKAKLS